MDFTINTLLCYQKALKQRLTQLEGVKNSSVHRTRFFDRGVETKVEEPTYDIKKVDKKITEINKSLLAIDDNIKRSNAITIVKIEKFDFDSLMSEIE